MHSRRTKISGTEPCRRKNVQIIPIASGKGGVGKSLLAANLALALTQAGKTVVLADLDLGCSNLHLILGLRAPCVGIGTFLNNPLINLKEIIVQTENPRLFFLPGDVEIPGIANLKPSQKKNLIRHLLGLTDVDFLILDLGAGTSVGTLDFFLMSSRGIIITTPTLTATLSAYSFLKNSIFRLLECSFVKHRWAETEYHRLLSGHNGSQQVYIPHLLKQMKKEDPQSYKNYKKALELFQPRFVFNMLDNPKDVEKSNKLRRSCSEYLGLRLEHLGIIYRDALQDMALASRLPILLYKPQAVLSQAIYRIADKIITSDDAQSSPLEYHIQEESFQTASVEAETDFELKTAYLEELLHSGALSVGDLMETVKIQQLEINKLKKENDFMKSKIVKIFQSGVKL